MEILEWLRESVGCGYISDLRREGYNRLAKIIISDADLSGYTAEELSDAAQYLFGSDVRFGSVAEAKKFFFEKLSADNRS